MPLDIEAPEFPAFWADCVNQGRIEELVALYREDAVLMPTFSPNAAGGRAALRRYFELLCARNNLRVTLLDEPVDCLPTSGQGYVISGAYAFSFGVGETLRSFPSRFTFVIDLGHESPILHHHSSRMPMEGDDLFLA